MQEKGTQHGSVLKVLKLLSYYLNVTDPLIIPMISPVYFVVKRLVITKKSFMKLEDIVVNHKSQLVQPNTDMLLFTNEISNIKAKNKNRNNQKGES